MTSPALPAFPSRKESRDSLVIARAYSVGDWAGGREE
jgi:hypothetical protein